MAANVITANELNYIIFRYLQESTFLNTAFNFGRESGIIHAPIYGTLIPTATLIRLVHKGLQYIEMEANLINDPGVKDEEFCFLETMDLITKDITELQKIVEDKKKSQHVDVVINENEGGNSGPNGLARELRRTDLNSTKGTRSRRNKRRSSKM